VPTHPDQPARHPRAAASQTDQESAMSQIPQRPIRNALLPVALVLSAFAGHGLAGEDPAVAAEVVAIVKAQWAAENQNRPAAQSWSRIADDYTEFNPQVPTLVEGKALAGRFYDASLQGGGKGLVSEMLNPHVQVYGDTAILTYNYAGLNQDREGKIENSLAKSTRVYVRQNGQWMLVHANFAPVVPPAD
jgi:ketosteroid isomerase-like protein